MEDKHKKDGPEHWETLNQNENNTNYQNLFNDEDVYRNTVKKKNKSVLITFVVLGFILILCLLLLFLAMKFAPNDNENLQVVANNSSKNQNNNQAIEILEDMPEDKNELSTETIAQNLIPSIVGITSTYTPPNKSEEKEGGSASGIVMSKDGYIITNAHAVVSSDKKNLCQLVQVHLSDNRIFNAQIVGVDTVTDIAVLKIPVNDLKVATFGNSDKLKVGQKAVAIGNPIGLELAGSVTQGIISGVSREIQNESAVKYIQTDAPINPGNSGGALINKYGQVIGINTAKIQSFEGIGFAIPINEAKPIIDDILKNGYVTDRVRIGITYQLVQQEIIDTMGIPKGMRVIAVDKTTDAYRKGLSAGDIITHIDKKQVEDIKQVADILKSKKAGDSLNLTIYRIKDEKPVTIELNVVLEIDTKGSIK